MRERLSLDRNWRFALGHAGNAAQDFEFARSRCLVKSGEARGAAGPNFDDSMWRAIDLPHDWALELPLDPRGDKELAEHGFRAVGPDHPQNSVGWYRRTFEISKKDLGRRICVEFDGVFRDSIVWINGHRLGRHESGYTGFRYDLTDCLNYGGKNVLVVRADVTNWEGWWYEGAGIYRHVWLVKTDPLHVAPQGVCVTTLIGKSAATISLRTKVINEGQEAEKFRLSWRIVDARGKLVATAKSPQATLKPSQEIESSQRIVIRNPKLWSCDEPNLYRVQTQIVRGSKSVDEVTTTFGIRSFSWDAVRGFFLNGKPLKIKGTCNHQQHAGLGIALPDRIQDLRVEKLKELGSNAYRCSHYAATPELLDACDRHGLLVMAENRLASGSAESLAEFENMILRDRNHPSIFLWSIANEEHTIQWSIAGERIGRTMVQLAHRLDPTRPVTAAMHDRGLNEGFAKILDVHGWNYIKIGDIAAFHQRRPDQPIVGSEEGSTVCTRGIYADDAKRGYVSAYDVRAPKWGSTGEAWWTFFAERPWLAGGFVWTGFDYYGEPIPYQWPCTASHFGLMDLCGFPKDLYYYFKSWWGDQTVLHLFPHWNWDGREGELIDVRVFSNCDEVELQLNGKSLGRQAIKLHSHLGWKVAYEPGKLEARGFRGGKRVAQARRETTGPAAAISIVADRKKILADGEDVAGFTVSAVDAEGRGVPTAENVVRFTISGRGRLLGVGNGDPSSHESDKSPFRRLFNGLVMVLVQSDGRPGEVSIRAEADWLTGSAAVIRAAGGAARKFVP